MTDIQELLKYDPISDAEEQTGVSYKDDDAVGLLGLLLGMQHNIAKESALAETDDTHYNTTFDDTLRIFEDEGFQVVHQRSFRSDHGDQERYLVLWNPEGILATAESFGGDRLNDAKILYNLEMPDLEAYGEAVSSGHLHQPSYHAGRYVLVGDHNVREGLRHKLNSLRDAGKFLPEWIERPWVWLLTYQDPKVSGYDHNAINAGIIEQLPVHVRSAITPTKES